LLGKPYAKEWPMSKENFPTVKLSPPHSINQLIEGWWADHFPGSAVARDTQAWNIAHAAKERLKQLLKGSE
jgi:hypothetical protein